MGGMIDSSGRSGHLPSTKILVVLLPYILATIVFLLGCTQSLLKVDVVNFDDVERPPNLSVTVFSDLGNITQPFKEIALLTIVSNEDRSIVVKRFREKAGEIGADAIVLKPVQEETSALIPVKGMWIPAKRRTHQAVAIVFTR
jgi:hypothetical protein